jgi:glycerophosphoryl diester phosphodiesterase
MLEGLIALAVVIVLYAIVYYTLLYHPRLLWNTHNSISHVKEKLPVKIAHRGGAAEVPENTIEAFQYAVDKGMHMIELDVHFTKDLKIVVLHDSSLERVTGEAMMVEDVEFKDLPNLLAKLPPSEFDQDQQQCVIVPDGKKHKIPLLEDVFKRFPDIWINIDLKSTPRISQLAEGVRDLIRKYNRESKTVWGNSGSTPARLFRSLAPEIPLFCGKDSFRNVVIGYCFGLLPFMRLEFDVFEPPAMHSELHLTPYWRELSDDAGSAGMLILRYALTSKGLYSHLNRRGIPSFAFGVNSLSAVSETLSLGVTGVMTDKPSLWQ